MSKAMKHDQEMARQLADVLVKALPAAAVKQWRVGKQGERAFLFYRCKDINSDPTDWDNLEKHIDILETVITLVKQTDLE